MNRRMGGSKTMIYPSAEHYITSTSPCIVQRSGSRCSAPGGLGIGVTGRIVDEGIQALLGAEVIWLAEVDVLQGKAAGVQCHATDGIVDKSHDVHL